MLLLKPCWANGSSVLLLKVAIWGLVIAILIGILTMVRIWMYKTPYNDMDSSSGTYMELHFTLKLAENLGEICHMVSRNELFCQNFCRNSSREHCSLNRASLEELNSWRIHENHPGNIHHLNESTPKFQVINFPIFSRAKKTFCLSNLRFRLRFSSYHQAAPGCRGQFSPRWKTGRRALVLERRCSGSTKQCERF